MTNFETRENKRKFIEQLNQEIKEKERSFPIEKLINLDTILLERN